MSECVEAEVTMTYELADGAEKVAKWRQYVWARKFLAHVSMKCFDGRVGSMRTELGVFASKWLLGTLVYPEW